MGSALLYPLSTERNFKNNLSYTTTESSNLDNSRKLFLVYLFWISLLFTRQFENPQFYLRNLKKKKKEKRKTHTLTISDDKCLEFTLIHSISKTSRSLRWDKLEHTLFLQMCFN